MKNIRRFWSQNHKGFTMIELLVLIAILGILAAVIIPNVTTFIRTGDLAAANTEASSVKTAVLGYYGRELVWPNSTLTPGFDDFYTGTIKGTYVFNNNTGLIISASGWAGLAFNTTSQLWER